MYLLLIWMLQRHKGRSQQARRSSIWKSGPRGPPEFKWCPIKIYLRKRPLGPIKRLLNLSESRNTNLKQFSMSANKADPKSCQAPIWPSLQVWDNNERLCGLHNLQLHPFLLHWTLYCNKPFCTICNCILAHWTALGFLLLHHTLHCSTMSFAKVCTVYIILYTYCTYN